MTNAKTYRIDTAVDDDSANFHVVHHVVQYTPDDASRQGLLHVTSYEQLWDELDKYLCPRNHTLYVLDEKDELSQIISNDTDLRNAVKPLKHGAVLFLRAVPPPRPPRNGLRRLTCLGRKK